MKVLVAEDDENSRLMLATVLEASGHSVVATVDGMDALAAACAAPPDLIVSDILMPRMDGFELCRRVKADPRLAHVPVVFYTATYTDAGDVQLGLDLGAARYLLKPMEPCKLLSELNAVATERGTWDSAAGPPEPADEPPLDAVHTRTLTRKLSKKIMDLEAANRALRVSEERFTQLAENIRECFWITDAHGEELIYASPAFETIWGYTIEERRADTSRWSRSIHPDDLKRIGGHFHERARMGSVDETYRIVRPDGSVRWVRDRASPATDANGRVYRIVGITDDVTQAQELAEQLTFQATYDPLTGLVNRRVFQQRLSRALAVARGEGVEHVLCYLDLDQFKVINDTCGHVAGDQLLQQVTQLFGKRVRKNDTLARLGGDEFGLLMERCTLAQGERVAEDMREAVQEFRFHWEGTVFTVGVSIGLVSIDATSESLTKVLSMADSACYAAKDQGKNRIHVYREDDWVLARRCGDMRWMGRLNAALETDRFALYQQPIVPISASADAASGVEILLRLRDENGELVAPGEFLPAAERYNLAARIDRWVVRHTLNWLSKSQLDEVFCSINLSGSSLSDAGSLGYMQREIARSRVPPHRLCFEVTETAAIANLSDATDFIRKLRAAGCRFALDDFGSGLSSFAYLKNLPVDYLKIDGSFMRNLDHDATDFALVKSISEIGAVMGKRTIAECVERDTILDQLKHIGVDYAQGHVLGEPSPCLPVS